MILTITTTHRPATDLGYLLHKHPDRLQTFPLSFGAAHVFYPEATVERCTAALVLDVDSVGLVRSRDATLAQYVNDRPFVASSFLSVAIAQVFGTALAGRSKDRPGLAKSPIPLESRIAVVPARGGVAAIERLFSPLGYEIVAEQHPLDESFPEWGEGRYFTVTLRHNIRLTDLLAHLYVLIPVLDGEKHYWIGDDEVDKLLAKGKDWLPAHPERNYIARRYLKHRSSLTRQAIQRLVAEENPDAAESSMDDEEVAVEKRLSLHEQRLGLVLSVLRDSGAESVLDLGCGEGRLLTALLSERRFNRIVGMDVSVGSIERAARRLRLDQMPERQRARLELIHGSLLYRDTRLHGFDAAAVVEVIEHLDAPRLSAFESTVFGHARPRLVVITTPNREYNALFESLPAGSMRHRDHRFEWTRAEFESWAARVAARHGYSVRFLPVGPVDERYGAPSQMGIFEINGEA